MFQGILGDIDLRGLTPSYSLAVVKNSQIVFFEGYPDFFVYDCASITKPLVTFPIVEKCFDLEEDARDYFSELPYSIKIKELVNHTSGLIPWLPLYLFKNSYRETIIEKGFKGKKGEKVYSCLNYILLKELVELNLKKPFKEIAEDFFKDFKNCFLPPLKCVNVAPTERGNVFEYNLAKDFVKNPDKRKFRLNRIIKGETHDLNSHYSNGIAGNSGLFANVFGVKLLIENLLEIQNFYLPLFERDDYFYHLGFTGTGIAIDKKQNVFVIFLSNYICPERKDINFSSIRYRIFKKCFERFV
ncbi:hypothetical protein TTHT_1819 [Thermotomaculum hydrothermale]|uniref:Beta-lactamase-related domain-containing protein n=1 Tax=Thermotomaculum hydrothermale TaxID=981385 RepID=A0A7R6PP70_9BACT|nr:serine hydrolase domain-containing protein [Thermotomaculum hydrothermale]BBB33278.1 hypothetical protein TTHT_1819 [Thermotomaculum hydrothermale]